MKHQPNRPLGLYLSDSPEVVMMASMIENILDLSQKILSPPFHEDFCQWIYGVVREHDPGLPEDPRPEIKDLQQQIGELKYQIDELKQKKEKLL